MTFVWTIILFASKSVELKDEDFSKLVGKQALGLVGFTKIRNESDDSLRTILIVKEASNLNRSVE